MKWLPVKNDAIRTHGKRLSKVKGRSICKAATEKNLWLAAGQWQNDQPYGASIASLLAHANSSLQSIGVPLSPRVLLATEQKVIASARAMKHTCPGSAAG